MKMQILKTNLEMNLTGTPEECLFIIQNIDKTYLEEKVFTPIENPEPIKIGSIPMGSADIDSALKEMYSVNYNEDPKEFTGDYTKKEIKEIEMKVKEKAQPISYQGDRKKLAMINCKECDSTWATMVDPNEQFQVHTCLKCSFENMVDIKSYKRGHYDCSCGAYGHFIQDEDISTVKCRSCKKEIYMVQDEKTKEFEGMK